MRCVPLLAPFPLVSRLDRATTALHAFALLSLHSLLHTHFSTPHVLFLFLSASLYVPWPQGVQEHQQSSTLVNLVESAKDSSQSFSSSTHNEPALSPCLVFAMDGPLQERADSQTICHLGQRFQLSAGDSVPPSRFRTSRLPVDRRCER